VGDSHTRICGYEVKQLLYNDFEVLGFVNPESRLKFIKCTAGVNNQQSNKEGCSDAMGWL
jgi:hypothetical protein